MQTDIFRQAIEDHHAARRRELELDGVTCPECEGLCEVVVAWTWASYYTPREPVVERCPTCHGEGLVHVD